MNLEEKFKQKQGITLIALVVTIIVLLILAGITIAMLTGQNGILNRATEARDANGTAQIDEQVKLAVAEALSNGLGTITDANLKAALDNNVGAGKYTLTGDATNGWTIIAGEKTYKINGNGDISGGDNTGGNTGGNNGGTTGDNDGTSIGGIYSEAGITEDQIAPNDLFEYRILNNSSKTASNVNSNLPTKTARITRIKEKYCTFLDGGTKKDTDGSTIVDTNYEIKYEGITDTLVVPYKVTLTNPDTNKLDEYVITEVCLAFKTPPPSDSRWDTWNTLPSIENIIYPNTVTKIYKMGDESGDNNYEICGPNHKLRRVVLPENIEEIPGSIFSHWYGEGKENKGLREIKIPDKVKEINDNAFAGNENLTEFDLNNVTKIGYYAFLGCTSINEIDLSNIKEIGNDVFRGWTSEQKIKVPFASTDSLPSGWSELWNRDCNAKIIYTDTNLDESGSGSGSDLNSGSGSGSGY